MEFNHLQSNFLFRIAELVPADVTRGGLSKIRLETRSQWMGLRNGLSKTQTKISSASQRKVPVLSELLRISGKVFPSWL